MANWPSTGGGGRDFGEDACSLTVSVDMPTTSIAPMRYASIPIEIRKQPRVGNYLGIRITPPLYLIPHSTNTIDCPVCDVSLRPCPHSTTTNMIRTGPRTIQQSFKVAIPFQSHTSQAHYHITSKSPSAHHACMNPPTIPPS